MPRSSQAILFHEPHTLGKILISLRVVTVDSYQDSTQQHDLVVETFDAVESWIIYKSESSFKTKILKFFKVRNNATAIDNVV